MKVAVTAPEAGAFFEAMARLSTGGVLVLFSDIEVPPALTRPSRHPAFGCC